MRKEWESTQVLQPSQLWLAASRITELAAFLLIAAGLPAMIMVRILSLTSLYRCFSPIVVIAILPKNPQGFLYGAKNVHYTCGGFWDESCSTALNHGVRLSADGPRWLHIACQALVLRAPYRNPFGMNHGLPREHGEEGGF